MSDVVARLIVVNIVAAISILVVGLSRRPLRTGFGARVAYAAWASVPVAVLAGLFPPSILSSPVAEPLGPVSLNALSQSAMVMSPHASAVFAALWMIGMATMALLLAWRQAAYLSWVGPLTPMQGGCLRARRAGIGPALVGFLRQRIILPADFEETFGPDAQALILEHERAHLRRGDAAANALAAAARCVFWFNPFVHWAAHAVRVDQELACDATVVQRFPSQRKAYGELLVSSQLAARPIPIGCHWPAPRGRLLKERLVMLKAPTTHWRRSAAGFALTGFLALAAGAAAWAAGQQIDVSGPWSFVGDIKADGREALAKPQCTFKQSGDTLSGSCKGPNSSGPAIGKIEGQHVSWRWTHTPYTKAGLGGVSTFDGVVGADKSISGTWTYSGLPGASGSFSGQRQSAGGR